MSGANIVHTIMRDLDRAEDRPRRPSKGRRRRRGINRKTRVFQSSSPGLGAYLRACRLRSGREGRRQWSLRSVARRAEICGSTLSQIETGKRRATAGDLLRLAAVLNEDHEALLVRAGYLPVTAPGRRPLSLSAAEQELIRRLRIRPQLVAPLNALLAALE